MVNFPAARSPLHSASLRTALVALLIVASLALVYKIASSDSLGQSSVRSDRLRAGRIATDPNSLNAAVTLEKRQAKRWIETISWDPRVFLYHNFLSQEECAHIVEMSRKKITRSMVVGPNGIPTVDQARTSDGLFITDELAEDTVVKAVQKRIAEWTHLPEENGEEFYVLRYKKGQQYVPHTDWFDEDDPDEARTQIGAPGNRMATVVICLHGPEEGGETVFPKANIKVPCTTGNAVLFWDTLPTSRVDPRSLHGGNPVLKGVKWAMTKWIRMRAFEEMEEEPYDESLEVPGDEKDVDDA